jgi:hypothetical protein
LNSLSHLYHEDLYRIQSGVVVILARPWHNILESEKALLTKILGSVRTNVDSVTLLHQPEVSLDSLKAFNASKVLIFGSQLSTEIKPYEKAEFGAMAVVKADDLNLLDDLKKKSLWVALKQMFGV